MGGDAEGPATAGQPAAASPGAPAGTPPAAATVVPPTSRRPRRGLRALLVVLALLGLYALLGFVVVPRVAQGQLAGRLSAELSRPVSIGRIEFNPFTLVLRVHDFSVAEPAGGTEFAGFSQLEADASWRSLYRLAPVLSSVSLKQPRVHLARDAQGRSSIQDLLDKWAARPPPPEPGPTPRFSVANIVIDDGRFVFDDAELGVRHEVAPFALRVPFVSSLPVDEKVYVEPSLRASVNGAAFELDGRSLPFSPTHESTIDVDLDGIDLTRFVGYSPVALPIEIRSARLDTALKVAFSQAVGAAPSISVTGNAKLASIDVRQPGGASLFAAESVAADPVSLEWPANRYTIGRVTVNAPVVAVQRAPGQRRFLEPVLAAIERGRGPGAAAPARPSTSAPVSATAAPATPASAGTAAAPAPAAAVPAAAAAPQWGIDEIVVTGGKLAFDDAQFQPKPLRVNAGAIEATVRKLVSDPAVAADFELAFGLDGGERVKAAGTASWRDAAVDAKAQVSDVQIEKWWWIAEPRLAVDATGKLALDARVRVTPSKGGADPAIRVEEGSARLADLSLRQRWDQRTLLSLPQLDLDGVSVDVAQRKVALGTLATKGGQLLVRRDGDARLNLQRLVLADGGAAKPADAKPEPARPAPDASGAAADWALTLDRLAIGGFGVGVEDERGGKAANLRVQAIDVGASKLSTVDRAPPARVEVSARVDRRGTLSVAGDVGIKPLAGALRVAARNLVIVPLQPYFTDYVNALVSSGSVSADGSLRFSVPQRGAPQVTWKGRASVADFAAVSKEANDDLLRWKSLAFDQVDFASEPLKVDVGSIALEDFYARVILNAEGRLNLREILVDRSAPKPGEGAPAKAAAAAKPATTPAPSRVDDAAVGAMPGMATPAPDADSRSRTVALGPPAAAPAPARNLRVGGVRLVNGNIDFSDFFVRPNYSANLTGMNGQISQITPGQAGDLELRGRIDHTGSVEVLGKVNPLADPLFLDLTANASDIDLPRLSPYSGKYVGYGIEKGKLSAKVAYKVENRQLTAENNIVLDQLTFGDKVDSPNAIKLPVLFAVSLLKDRNGVIDVNLPISGSLDDPQFSIGGIVLRIIVNLIVKAVTAPFTLIANLVGASGAELSWVGFEPGNPELDAPARKKLEAVAKALNDRPGLKLDLSGRADPAADREALRHLALLRAVKAQKLKETVGSGGDVAAVDKVQVDPQEYPKYLEMAWRAAKFDKPRNVIGLVKSQPPAEMERMMLAHIEASDAELTALANERAQHVKDWLVETGKVPGERMFIVSPKLGGADRSVAAGSAAGTQPGAAPEAAQAAAAPAAAAPAAAAATAPRSAPPVSRVDLSLK
ncbi:MAG: DUF748 domain-containing protein [Burkholderiaceae bacterium]